MALLLSAVISSYTDDAKKKSRITVIDVLRGFALFGMIMTHSFNAFWHQIRLEHGDGFALNALDSLFDTGADVFLVRKFFTIFSFLFGLGFAMQFKRAKEKGKSITGRFIWRLLILLMIGTLLENTIHAGEILQIYAFLGLLLLFSHTWKENTLVFFAVFVFILNLFISQFPNPLSGGAEVPVISHFSSTTTGMVAFFTTSVKHFISWIFSGLFSGRLLMEASLFLFGQYVGRKDVFSDTEKNKLLFHHIFRWGGAIALGTTLSIAFLKLSGILQSPVFSENINFHSLLPIMKATQQLSMSFFYIACMVIAYRMDLGKKLLNWLEPAGKMALTTFIIQAVFILFLDNREFVKQAGLAATMAFGFLFFVLQVLFAAVWMSYFSQGPVEWLWRSLTFLKWQSFRRSSPGKPEKPKLHIS